MRRRTAAKRCSSTSLAACVLVAYLSLSLPLLANELTAGGIDVDSQPAEAAEFEIFVRRVGIDITTVPAEIRRQWSSAPRVSLDDCGIPGTQLGHSHDDDESRSARSPVGGTVK